MSGYFGAITNLGQWLGFGNPLGTVQWVTICLKRCFDLNGKHSETFADVIIYASKQQKATPASKLSMFCCKLKLIPLTNTLGKFWLWKTCVLCWCVERAGDEILRLIQSYFRSTLWSNSIPTKRGIILSLRVWDKKMADMVDQKCEQEIAIRNKNTIGDGGSTAL